MTFLIETILLWSTIFGIPQGGADGGGAQPSRIEVETFQLRYADPNEVGNQIRMLFGQSGPIWTIADSRTNLLVLRSFRSTLDEAKELVRTLDVEVPESLETAMITLRNRPANVMEQFIPMQLSPRGKFAIDGSQNAVIVRDSPSMIRTLRENLDALDVSPRSLTLEFTVLGPSSVPLPSGQEFNRVQQELGRLGLSGYGVIGRTGITTLDGEKFRTSGSFENGNLQFQGRVGTRKSSDMVELTIDADVSRVVGPERKNASFSSTLSIPLGHQAIVGLAPAGGPGHEPLVLLIQAK